MSYDRTIRKSLRHRRAHHQFLNPHLHLESLENRLLLSTFVVTNTLDAGVGSLRQAIIDANANIGPDVISFDIPTSDSGFIDTDSAVTGGDASADAFQIDLLSALPALSDVAGGVRIDGTTQTSSTGDTNALGPEVILNGLSAGPGVSGLTISSDGNEVHGLVIRSFSLHGVAINGGAQNNWLAGNHIGIDASGTLDQGNTSDGVNISASSNNNRIGTNADGTNDAAERNVISGNNSNGVEINGSDQNIITGNLIGMRATGLVRNANTSDGVLINDGSSNVIGGSSATERNIISGNFGTGVRINGFSADANVVQGNFIGTNITGTSGVSNGNGVTISGGDQNLIGGLGAGEGNVISGNTGSFGTGVGVEISGNSSGSLGNGNKVIGNLIGTDVTGTSPIPNTNRGVALTFFATFNTVQGNVISGNGDFGVDFGGAPTNNLVTQNLIGTDISGLVSLANASAGVAFTTRGSTPAGSNNTVHDNTISGNTTQGLLIGGNDNTITANRIGVGSDGVTPVGNGSEGVRVTNGVDNTIGGINPTDGNTVANNGGTGLQVQIFSGVRNAFLSNSVTNNAGFGIDLSVDGPTANDPGDGDIGANNLQNHPILTAASIGATTTTVSGSLNSLANETFTLQFFANSSEDSPGIAEAQVLLGSIDVVTDALGNASFSAVLGTLAAPGDYITSTATLAETDSFSTIIGHGDTSELSPTVQIPPNTPPVVDIGGPYAVNEESSVLLDASGTTDAQQAGNTLVYEWDLDGDGNFDDAVGITTTFSAVGLDGPTVVNVSVRATDDGGLVGTGTTTVSVLNVDPTADAGGTYSVDEGGSVSLSASGSDIAGVNDPLTFEWDFDNDGNFDDAVGTSPVFDASTLDGDATITVHLRVTDGDGGSATDSASIEILNVAPTADAGGPYTVDEGGSISLAGIGSDVAGVNDPLTFEWDLDNDGVFDDAVGASPVFDASALDGDTTVTVHLRVTDGDGGLATDSATIDILNVAPTIDVLDGETQAVRGQPLTYNASASDPVDVLTQSWEVTDSSNIVVASGTGGSIDFTPIETGEFTITHTADDGDGGIASESLTLSVTVTLELPDPENPGFQVLRIGGSQSSDIIKVRPGSQDGEVIVKLNELNHGHFRLRDSFGPIIGRIVVYGQDGNDFIRMRHRDADVITQLYGGNGHDYLSGGKGVDFIYGGNGGDLIAGRNGRDILIGGDGYDFILGQRDDDILIGGDYIDANSEAAALALLAAWNDANDYLTRISNISMGVGAGGIFKLDSTTVSSDGVRDWLFGLQGLDWFLADDNQDCTDERANEVLTVTDIEFLTGDELLP